MTILGFYLRAEIESSLRNFAFKENRTINNVQSTIIVSRLRLACVFRNALEC
jgi:hypothetical protein